MTTSGNVKCFIQPININKTVFNYFLLSIIHRTNKQFFFPRRGMFHKYKLWGTSIKSLNHTLDISAYIAYSQPRDKLMNFLTTKYHLKKKIVYKNYFCF